ncbi:MAG TPA: pitrilysin family protein [Thermoanaerobaculia bacterium]
MKHLLIAALMVFPLYGQEATQPQTQTAPPPPAAPREAKIPQPVERTLSNGLRVIVVPKPGIPLVAARLMIKTGAAADPAGRAGLADMTATVLTKGTKTQSAEQIARGVEALGATLNAEAGWDSTAIDVSVMSSNLAKTLGYVADVARNATFAKDELERERGQAVDALQVSLRQPRSLANMVASRLVFGESAYGHNLAGTPASLAKLTRDDLVKFHRTYYRPDNAVLVFAGDINADTAFSLASNAFGDWPRGAGAVSSGTKKFAPSAPRAVIVDLPAAGQAAVVVARPGLRRSDPNYMRALVANSILGGGYSARLNQEVRIKRGLSYGAGSSFEPRADVGPFTARTETKNESAAEVVGLVVGEMSKLSASDVPESELTPRKAVLIGGFAQSLETTSGIVNRVSNLALYGLPLSEINQYISGVQSVTAQQVREFAAANMPGTGSTIVVVGDAKKFEPALRQQYSDVEVIPVTDLDLDSPTLRVRKRKE